MRRPSLCLLAAGVALAATPAAAQRQPEPQAHEVRLDVDISVEREANGAYVEGQYTWTPAKLNRVDEVVPILRRYVRHPSAVWVRILRHGYSREPVTGASAGGILQLGPAYVTATGGIEYNVVEYDPGEHAYWALPVQAEAGFRPAEGMSVGAFYTMRPVLKAVRDDFIPGAQAERDGNDQRIGGRIAYATPGDTLFASLAGWGRFADWTFEEFHPGDVSIRGLGADARVGFQLTSSFTFGLRFSIARDQWDNDREGDDEPAFVGERTERDVVGLRGGAEVVYWHKGRFGFRFGLGGGYEGAPPTRNNRETGVVQIGLGVITRF
jgi:hypothetical protein